MTLELNPLIAAGVLGSTAATDAVYVMFNAAVTARRPARAANWSGLWYVLSAFAVISYTGNPDLCAVRRQRFVGGRILLGPVAQKAQPAANPGAARAASFQ